ncbi:MAG: tetratricopeptide repeat protein [Candidatus Omnitrophota bacterium]
MNKFVSIAIGVLLAVAALLAFALYGAEVKKNQVLKNENAKTYQDLRRELEASRLELKTKTAEELEDKNKLLGQVEQLNREKEELRKQAQELEEKIIDEEDVSVSMTEDVERLRLELSRVKKERAEIASRLEEGFKKKKQAYDMKLLSLESQLEKAKNRLSREGERYHYNLGVTYVRNQDYENAAKELKTSLSYNPNNAKAHYNLGIIYDDYFKDKKQARFHYKAFLELQPVSDEAESVREWLEDLDA